MLTWLVSLEAPLLAPRLRVQGDHVVVPGADVERVVAEQRRRLHRRRAVAPQLTARIGVPGDHIAVRTRLVLQALDGVHVGLVDDAFSDRRRRGGAAVRVLLPVDPARLRVQREEQALLLGEVHAPIADRGRELERVVRVDLPEAPERRPVVVGGDVLAPDVVAVGRPGARDLPVGRRRRRLGLVGDHELLRGGAPLLERLVLVVGVDADRDREHDHEQRNADQQTTVSAEHRRVRMADSPAAAVNFPGVAKCASSLAGSRR